MDSYFRNLHENHYVLFFGGVVSNESNLNALQLIFYQQIVVKESYGQLHVSAFVTCIPKWEYDCHVHEIVY